MSGETLRAPRQQLRQFAPQPSIFLLISQYYSNPHRLRVGHAVAVVLARVISVEEPNRSDLLIQSTLIIHKFGRLSEKFHAS